MSIISSRRSFGSHFHDTWQENVKMGACQQNAFEIDILKIKLILPKVRLLCTESFPENETSWLNFLPSTCWPICHPLGDHGYQ